MLHVHEIDLRKIFECAHLKFTVYGHKQESMYVNTLPQCSPARVGLTQACPNYDLHVVGYDDPVHTTKNKCWFDLGECGVWPNCSVDYFIHSWNEVGINLMVCYLDASRLWEKDYSVAM